MSRVANQVFFFYVNPLALLSGWTHASAPERNSSAEAGPEDFFRPRRRPRVQV